MTVADLEALLTAAGRFAEAAGISAPAKTKLSAACAALAPFRALDVLAFAELLRQADDYQRTGILPPPTKSTKRAPKKPAPNAEDKAKQVEQIVQQLHDLYAVVHEETVGFGAIDEICEMVGKLGAPEVKQVASRFGIKVRSKTTRPEAVEEIKRKLTEQKGSAQRIQPIASS
jgi:hypothetical protein